MTTINMLRGGVGNGDNRDIYTGHMYPRPDLLAENMSDKMGWENAHDSVHAVHRWNSCKCWDHGAIKRAKDAEGSSSCSLEVGDEIPLVWIPNRHTLEAITLSVNSGIEGVVLGVKRSKVLEGAKVMSGATTVGTVLTGSAAGPLPSTVIGQPEIDALACNERMDLDKFCGECDSQGCFYEHWFASPILIGGCEYEGQYLSLVIEALPEDFDCASCCLDVSVGARLRIPFIGD